MPYKKKPETLRKEREAQDRWHRENTEKLSIGLRKGARARYNLLAERRGVSLASMVKSTLEREFLREVTTVEMVGKWWSDSSIDLVKVDGAVYALYGWNGEKFTDCWECSGDGFRGASGESYTLAPVYRWEVDGMNVLELEEGSSEWENAIEIVDYSVSRN